MYLWNNPTIFFQSNFHQHRKHKRNCILWKKFTVFNVNLWYFIVKFRRIYILEFMMSIICWECISDENKKNAIWKWSKKLYFHWNLLVQRTHTHTVLIISNEYISLKANDNNPISCYSRRLKYMLKIWNKVHGEFEARKISFNALRWIYLCGKWKLYAVQWFPVLFPSPAICCTRMLNGLCSHLVQLKYSHILTLISYHY